ncbi:hypothetical protein TREMEDRAFT_67918 [Tremella mesenterica DSM 1558]|uniref:uncharacterized protein n=1 Tax=Tremella mesenterica (strain ATCC 24925 / CBS 8224 / DSM 1558 / NBRC 9311 / NRRL Y-6157 / RJB 2259-6 / UBC 559-6) TaxID=578456 RepID=UPI0003F48E42|nr:uncharacterized protein TREMEDRAFT_67918 [Tremella mesenterica DSM 1558]EIW71710.1 hypothetical protein TREMEDRAFT_67918 [Tremella mesenterica DSM 1558]
MATVSPNPSSIRFADIAVNFTDPMFQGIYHGKTRHDPDLDHVISRARSSGISRMLITGTSLSESRAALDLAKKYDLHCTAGIHPTSTSEISNHPSGPEDYLSKLRELIAIDRGEGGSKRIISIGEIGLDYDRLHHSPRETQLRYLPKLLSWAKEFNLPLFLHSRSSEAHVDLMRILREVGWDESWRGVIHSFTGTKEEMYELIEQGLYIGINGCALKLSQGLDVVREIPENRILLETDSPWCSITSTHASYPFLPPTSAQLKKVNHKSWSADTGIKGRQEPSDLISIAHIVAKIRGVTLEYLARVCWENTERLFHS